MKKTTIIKTIGIVTAFSLAIPAANAFAGAVVSTTDQDTDIVQSISNSASQSSLNQTDNLTGSTGSGANTEFTAPPEGNPPEGNPPEGAPGGNPPDGMPQGNPPDGIPGGNSSGGMQSGNGAAPGPGFGPGSSANVIYTAVETISSDTTQSGKTITSDTADESALLVTGGTVTENSLAVKKTGSSNGGDSCNFYGQNAAVLAKDGAVLYINNADIYSDASGANGVFSYGGNGGRNGAAGDGTTVNISDSTIVTKGSGSGGIMTTGGGTTNAKNLTITTYGQSSAAIRTDRGGGTVNVDGGTYTTNGLGSPAVYSTADITVKNSDLVSTLSEGVVIEGKNTVTLENVNLTTNNTKTNSNATHYDSVFMYQSMSGDADSGTSVFSMTGGTVTTLKGEVFHVTNTNAVINLKGVNITNKDMDNVLLTVTNDGWSGSHNIATLNADSQKLSGSIIVSNTAVKDDNPSKLTLNLKNSSVFEGSINTSESDKGEVIVTIDKTSTLKLTADTYVTSITGSGCIDYNGYTLYVGSTAYSPDNPLSGFKKDQESSLDASGNSSDEVAATDAVNLKNTSKTIKADTLKSAKKSYYVIKTTDGQTVSVSKYYKNAADYIKVSAKGKVTVKKGTPAGTYKIRINVKSADGSGLIAKTIRIRVK